MRRYLVRAIPLLAATAACEPQADPLRPDGSAAAFPPPLLAAAAVEPPVPAGTVVYDAIPTPFPGSYASLGFQATRTDAWGDWVQLTEAGTLGKVTVGLATWACENDGTRAPSEACESGEGATFSHPVTVSLYEVDLSGAEAAVGPLLATQTATFEIPYRPSWDAESCLPPTANMPFGGKWFDPILGTCVNGLATTVTFDFAGEGVALPDQVIFAVVFDTESAGEVPIGAPGPYNSLNLGVANFDAAPPPSVGSDVEADHTFWDTDLANWYCDGGAGGVDVLRRDGCWSGITPVVRIELAAPANEEPAAVHPVTAGGWWDDGSGLPPHPSFSLSVRPHPRTDRLTGQLQLQLPAAGLRVHAADVATLAVVGDEATIAASGRSPAGNVDVALVLGDGTGPDGEDTVAVLVSLADGGAVLYDSGGPQPLRGGSVQIHR